MLTEIYVVIWRHQARPAMFVYIYHELMMTSSNGNIFRVTGHLCGEFTDPRWIPRQRPVTRSFDVFFVLRLNNRLSKQSWGWWFEMLPRPLWRHCNVHNFTCARSYVMHPIIRHLMDTAQWMGKPFITKTIGLGAVWWIIVGYCSHTKYMCIPITKCIKIQADKISYMWFAFDDILGNPKYMVLGKLRAKCVRYWTCKVSFLPTESTAM